MGYHHEPTHSKGYFRVVRVGPSGGQKTMAVYKDEEVAVNIANTLEANKHNEA
jgi:hypothetical protein